MVVKVIWRVGVRVGHRSGVYYVDEDDRYLSMARSKIRVNFSTRCLDHFLMLFGKCACLMS